MARKIILDCDPGVDDSLAILLALASPEEIDLQAITCVAGNVPLDLTEPNARRVLALAGRSVPVHRGCARPLMQVEGRIATAHGSDGIGGVALPAPAQPTAPGHAVDAIIERVLAAPGEITLCAVGPLTNLALAIVKEPRVVEAAAGLVLMGGAAYRPGNATAAAEFNILVDPHAAHIVFSAGWTPTMFGLDVTEQVVAVAEYREMLAGCGRVGPAVGAMLDAYTAGDPSVHDPCVIAHLIDPGLFEAEDAFVAVSCDPMTYGQTVASPDPRKAPAGAAPCRVVTAADAPRVFALMAERLGRL